MIKHTLLFLFIYGFCSLYSQNVRLFSSEKELTNNLVNCIIQDQKGFIWIGTENVLNRFDGMHFNYYFNSDQDSLSLKSSYVSAIFEDQHNRLWIGSICGIQLFNYDKNNFTTLKDEDNMDNYCHVSEIIERKNGDIWFGTHGKGIMVCEFNEANLKIKNLDKLTSEIKTLFINTLYEDSECNIWIVTNDKGLYKFNPSNNQLKHYSFPLSKGQPAISCINEDEKGHFIIGTLNS